MQPKIKQKLKKFNTYVILFKCINLWDEIIREENKIRKMLLDTIDDNLPDQVKLVKEIMKKVFCYLMRFKIIYVNRRMSFKLCQ